MPEARPSRTRRAAVSMARAAMRPEVAVPTPGVTAIQPSSVEAITGMAEAALPDPRPLSDTPPTPVSTTRTTFRGRSRDAARAITSGSPTAIMSAARRSAGLVMDRTTISGPIPAGSPIVSRRVGRRVATSDRPPGSVLQLDVDGLLDLVVPALVGLLELLVLNHLAEVFFDLVVLVVGLRDTAEHLEDVETGLALERHAHLAGREPAQGLAQVRGQLGHRNLSEHAARVPGRAIGRVLPRHGGEVRTAHERVP